MSIYNNGHVSKISQIPPNLSNLCILLLKKGGVFVGLYLTTPQFAKQVGVSKNTVINWERQGLIVPHHVSPTGRRYYSHEQVESVLAGKTKGVALGVDSEEMFESGSSNDGEHNE